MSSRKIASLLNIFYYSSTSPHKLIHGEGRNWKDPILKRPSLSSFPLYGSTLFSFLSILHIIRVAYFLFLTFPEYLEKGDSIRLIFHGGWILCWGLIFSQHLAPLFISQDMVELTYGLALLSCKIEQRFEKSDMFSRARHLRHQIIFSGFACMLISMVIVNGPVFYMFREEPWHFGSNLYRLLSPFIPEFAAYLVSVIPENLYMAWTWGTFIIHMNLNFMFLQLYSKTLRFFSQNCSQNSVHLQMKTISELRILTSVYNGSYGKYYIAPITNFQLLLTTLGIVVTIKFLSQSDNHLIAAVGILTSITTGSIMFLIVEFTGNLYEDSANFYLGLEKKIRSWSLRESSKSFSLKVIKKSLKRCKVDAIQFGTFSDIRKITSLEMLSALADTTTTLLLSFDV